MLNRGNRKEVRTRAGPMHICIQQVPQVMAALRSRCGHYIFALWFLSFFFFPHLISAVGDWMSTILRHMAWP